MTTEGPKAFPERRRRRKKPIIAVRLHHDVRETLDRLIAESDGKLEISGFVREAIDEKLINDYGTAQLKVWGYVPRPPRRERPLSP